jgi:hypothetical protein
MKFNDLSNAEKDEVRRQYEPDYEWWDYVYDNAKEDAEQYGFRIDDISFSGFYSQGDGASWTGSVDLITWLEKHRPDCAKATIMTELIAQGWVDSKTNVIRLNSLHVHSWTMQVADANTCWPGAGYDYGQTPVLVGGNGILARASVEDLVKNADLDTYFEEMLSDVLVSVRDYADEIYKRLQTEYEYITSDEYIAEQYEFN